MSALNNQTNRNNTRYFFATSENGEQTLGLQYGTAGTPALSTMAVTISGASGNGVIVNQAPQFVASEFVLGDEAVCGGSASTYFTPSTLTSNYVGFNLSYDRLAASGTTTIESYQGNGNFGGYEFLIRGVNGSLLSTNSVGMNEVMKSSFGKEGASASLNAAGTFATGQLWADQHNSVALPTGGAGRTCYTIEDLSGINTLNRWSMGTTVAPTGGNQGSDLAIFSYLDTGAFNQTPLVIKRDTGAASFTNLSSVNGAPYPQSLVQVPPSAISPGAVSVPNASPTVVLTIPIGTTLVTGANYLTDINVVLQVANPLANPVFLQMGVRLGGNGAFNYENPLYVPPGGIPVILNISLSQISDMGSSTANIDIVAYQQSLAPGGTITVTASTSSGAPPHLLKMIT